MTSAVGQIRSHKDLEVWRRAMALTRRVYELTDAFPRKEEFRLTSQMIRAAVSIAANIAEGNARGTRKDYAHFVSIARGSAAELETLLLIAKELSYVRDDLLAPLIRESEELAFMLCALRDKLQNAS